MLSRKTSLTCFLRSYLLGGAFTPQGMQSLGITHALEPGLAEIYADPEDLLCARQRYIRHFNTHPFGAPFLLGLFLKDITMSAALDSSARIAAITAVSMLCAIWMFKRKA